MGNIFLVLIPAPTPFAFFKDPDALNEKLTGYGRMGNNYSRSFWLMSTITVEKKVESIEIM